MAELPLHLKKLESLPGALDMLRYLYQAPDHYADEMDICDDLEMSARRFSKAKMHLVTTGYISMRSDGLFELTNKGEEASTELAAYDGESTDASADTLVNRHMVLVLPRTLVAGQPATLKYGLEPDHSGLFSEPVNLLMRFQTIHADLSSDGDELTEIASDAFVAEMQMTPQAYDKVRLLVEVYQLARYSDSLSECGGMYVDIFIEEQANNEDVPLVAYGIDLALDPTL